MKQNRLGLLYAFGALIATSLVFLLGRTGVKGVPLPVFLFYWYLFALPPFAVMSLMRPDTSPWRVSRKRWKVLVVYFIYEILAVNRD